MIKAVLFDMDGVLVDSFEAWAKLVDATAKHFGYPSVGREEFLNVYGQSTELDVDKFFPGSTVMEIDNYYEIHFQDFKNFVVPIEESHEVINALKAKSIKTSVITNTGGRLARTILNDLGIVVDCVIGGDEVSNPKPAPDIVIKACEILGVLPSESVVVGDSVYDMESASVSGARSVGVNGILGDYTLSSISELFKIWDNIIYES